MKNTESYLLLTSLRVCLLIAGCFGIPTSNEGECLFIDSSTVMYYASWPVSAPVQIQYKFKSLVRNFWL